MSKEKLEALQKKREALTAQIARLEAEAKATERKAENRLKIIVGAALLADARLHSETALLLGTALDRAVTAPRDREFLISRNWIKPNRS